MRPLAHDVVDRVALDRHPSRLPDHRHQLGDGHLLPGLRPGGVRDLLLDHRPVDVVHAEVQGDLGELGAHHDPERLDVREVVEVEPPDRERQEVLQARRVPFGDLRVLRVERQRDERLEPAGPVLELPEAPHVVDPRLERLHVSVQHRRVAAQPRGVHGFHHLEPPVPGDLLRADPVPDLGIEDFGAASRQAPQARLLQLMEDFVKCQSRDPGEVVDLHRGEGLEVHLGEALPQGPQREQVEIERQVGVQPPDNVELRRFLEAGLLCPAQDLLHRHRVGQGLPLGLAERAELAPVDADVRRVDVPVDDEIHPVAVLPPVGEVRHLPHKEDVPGSEEGEGVLLREPVPRMHLIPDGS